ncbi:MAG TPA: M48 family metalloprotease, partial [Burkholderiales bacterium]|nr:M48 family metalloprotease [Burkholderiales bacterium]
KADAEVRKEYGIYEDPELQAYVSRVGQKLARASHRPGISYTFVVVDSPEINAFALPGGYVYVTRGILAYLGSEAELAAVVGHEIGHVTARHGVRQQSAAMATGLGVGILGAIVPGVGGSAAQNVADVVSTAVLSGYGREQELEADRLGAQYLARTGYDPQAMIRVVEVLKNQELFDAEVAKKEGRETRAYHGLFASHPDNDTRLKEVVGEASKFAKAGAFEGEAEYDKAIDGIVYGDSPQQGIVRGSNFFHAEMGFALSFPKDWRLKNGPDRVQAASPSKDAIMELSLAGKAQGSPADALRKLAKLGSGETVETTAINGLPAASVTVQRSGRPIRATLVQLGGNSYLIAGTAKDGTIFQRYGAEISAAIRSFHPITEAERKLARPLTLRVVKAKKGDTFAGLASRSPLGPNAEGYLRLVNDAYPKGEPMEGRPLRIIE